MTQTRGFIPALGFLMWSGIILAFDRHDTAFYGASFCFSLSMTLLAMASTSTQQAEVEVKEAHQEAYHD